MINQITIYSCVCTGKAVSKNTEATGLCLHEPKPDRTHTHTQTVWSLLPSATPSSNKPLQKWLLPWWIHLLCRLVLVNIFHIFTYLDEAVPYVGNQGIWWDVWESHFILLEHKAHCVMLLHESHVCRPVRCPPFFHGWFMQISASTHRVRSNSLSVISQPYLPAYITFGRRRVFAQPIIARREFEKRPHVFHSARNQPGVWSSGARRPNTSNKHRLSLTGKRPKSIPLLSYSKEVRPEDITEVILPTMHNDQIS